MSSFWLGSLGLGWGDHLALFAHFLMLSMLAIGGAIVTVPDMHRYLVAERGWLSEVDFTSGIAIAQAAPGPNVLFVAVLGYFVAGFSGALVALAGSLLPSTVFALAAASWGERHRASRGVRAFTFGLAPITIGLLVATGWLLTEPARGPVPAPALLALTTGTAVVMSMTKWNPVWLVAAGAVLGALGWV
jgi:chromate transporter